MLLKVGAFLVHVQVISFSCVISACGSCEELLVALRLLQLTLNCKTGGNQKSQVKTSPQLFVSFPGEI